MKTLLHTTFAIGLVGVALLSTAPAGAQQLLCLSHDEVVAQLDKKFAEQAAGRGLAKGGKAMFGLFVSETGSWTMVTSKPNGTSCIVASGDSWHELPLVLGDPA